MYHTLEQEEIVFLNEGVMMKMKQVNVKFDTVEEVEKFVHIVERFPEDIDILCGSYAVDGKSILGILSYGLKKPLKMRVYSDGCEALIQGISFCTCA